MEAQLNIIEYRLKRVAELKEYLACYSAMRAKILSYAPPPGLQYNFLTKQFEEGPWSKETQDLLDRVDEMEKAFVEYWFPDLYNNLYNE